MNSVASELRERGRMVDRAGVAGRVGTNGGADRVDESSRAFSQTLSRGIRVLEEVSASSIPLTAAQVANRVNLNRSVTYRLLRTLEQHGLVARGVGGGFVAGARLAVLGLMVARDFRAVATPALQALADEVGLTCFIGVLDGADCITYLSAIPVNSVTALVQHPGARHPLTVGAPGRAILAQLQPGDWPVHVSDSLRRELTLGMSRGYFSSHDEVLAGVNAVAVTLRTAEHRQAALAALYCDPGQDISDLAGRLGRVAASIESRV